VSYNKLLCTALCCIAVQRSANFFHGPVQFNRLCTVQCSACADQYIAVKCIAVPYIAVQYIVDIMYAVQCKLPQPQLRLVQCNALSLRCNARLRIAVHVCFFKSSGLKNNYSVLTDNNLLVILQVYQHYQHEQQRQQQGSPSQVLYLICILMCDQCATFLSLFAFISCMPNSPSGLILLASLGTRLLAT